MILQFIFALLLGVFAGIFSGLTPGIHINLIAATLFSLAIFSNLEPIFLVVFITSMAITHTFLDFIPSIFLGAPEEETALSILPGHKMLLMGRGDEAVNLTLIGSLLSIGVLLLIIPLFVFLVPKTYGFISRMMGFILIWISIFLIINEKKNKIASLIVFILAGFLGISTLGNSSIEPLLPLFTGLFGTSTLINSIRQKTQIPKQEIEKLNIDKKELIKPVLATTIVSPVCSFLPSIGSSQSAIISSTIFKDMSQKQFLILLGSINTLVMAVSFLTLFLIGKSRTGAALAVGELINVDLRILFLILITIIVSSVISFFIARKISRIFAKNIHKINYTFVSLIVIFIITSLILIFSGFSGFLIYIVSVLLGLTCIELNVSKSFLMGVLIIPTILFYLPI